jgi:TRAP-type uncharacterized transport system fused permease subunit
MGATVFVMASYTGIPYLQIAKASLIPALMYFVMLLIYAELNAQKLNIAKLPFELNLRGLFFDAPLFVVPLASLVTMMMLGYSLMMVVFWSVMIVIALGLISGIRAESRINWVDVRDKFAEGALMGANVALILAVIGIAVAGLEVTGLTMKLSMIFSVLGGDNLFILLILTMLVSLILGTGVPTPAAYVIVATVLSPILIKQGLPAMQAHLFPMFYAFLSHLTPPVGIGLLIACKLSGAEFGKGAIEVFKAAFPSLLLPYLFVYAPALLLQYDDITSLIYCIVGTLLLFFSLAIFMNNQWKSILILREKTMLGLSFLGFFYFVFIKENKAVLLAGIILCGMSLAYNMRRPSKGRARSS